MKFNSFLVALIAVTIWLPFMSYGEDLSALRQKAQQGDAAAQYRLGAAYAFGDGVPQDYKAAVNLWQLSAQQGNAYAQYNLGVLYAQGQGVPQNHIEAVKYYRLAAAQGFAKAQYNLGAAYYNGTGVPKDRNEAEKWFHLSKEQIPATSVATAEKVITGIVIALVVGIIVWIFFRLIQMEPKSNNTGENKKTEFWDRIRRGITREILRDSAMQAYLDADEKTRQKIMNVALRAGALAVLNPEKTRQVKEFLTGGGQPSAQNRLEKLKQVHEQGLITSQEYEAKKAEVIRQL